MRKYDHERIEKKWQTKWEDENAFKAELDKSKPKYYVLDMFPYPSGAGLHVGHVTGYTATDIVSRYKRQNGYNVLHPMGWDSFGLPAEQYAVRTGTHPSITTEKNINTYRKQLKSLGFSYDWSREFATSDPKYYKWTQWIFTKLFEKGLAYEAEVQVNFCPALGTVLANEEVENGKAKEGGYPIERRPLRQWILKITEYAERLLNDLDELDWPDYLKQLQRNWIGKSEGCRVDFPVVGLEESFSCFTTRADTIFGVTFLVVSPEHPIVSKITSESQASEVKAYIEKTKSKSDLERTDLNKNKEGAFTGGFATHPITKQKLPVWISDYVLMNYGTGAIMAVPAHDERDFDFAKKYDLPIQIVVSPDSTSHEDSGCYVGNGKIVNSEFEGFSLNGLSKEQAITKASSYLQKLGLGEKTTTYKLRDWLFSRQRYWGEPFPILHFEDGTKRILELDELPLIPPSISDYKPSPDGQSPLAKAEDWVNIQDPKTGKKAKRETNTMPQWAGSCWYYLRFCDPNNELEAWNKEIENYWMPVDLYVGGVEHAVLHLLYARFWHKVLFDLNLVSTNEPFKTLRNQGLVTAKSFKLEGGGYIEPDLVESEKEKGSKVIEQVEKMSKSKLNGITPDAIIEEYGADSLRLYEMFMGPFDKEKLWNTDAVNGCYRFLNRVFDLCNSPKISEEDTEESLRLSHLLVSGVINDIDKMLYNTAISKMMEFMNAFAPLKKHPVNAIKWLLQMIYPFAPHIAEEGWELIGMKNRIIEEPYPVPNEKYLENSQVTYVVQVNGKVRGRIDSEKDKSKDEILALAREEPNIKKFLSEEILKVIFVPNKLLNIVVKK